MIPNSKQIIKKKENRLLVHCHPAFDIEGFHVTRERKCSVDPNELKESIPVKQSVTTFLELFKKQTSKF